MRYQLELVIAQPRDQVVNLFLDPDNLAKWQPDFVDFEHLEGPPARHVGARSRQVHRMGRREVEMIETITVHNWPEEFSATYEADGVWNLVENKFTELEDDRTHWQLSNEFRCTGFVRLMAMFMPGMFRRHTFNHMKKFKAFAES